MWSGDVPRFDTHRIAEHADGLELGRPLVHPTDDRISGRHARLTINRDDCICIDDLGSRNGTYVDGTHITSPVLLRAPPNIVRLGRSVFVIVPEIRPFEHIPLTKREGLVIGGTLDRIVRAVDTAAIEVDNLVLAGTRSVGLPLARCYARAFGDEFPIFEGTTNSVESVLKGSPRALVLELGSNYLTDRDRNTIDELLETDLRIVTRIRSKAQVAQLPARLATRVIELPTHRYDELPMTLLNIVREVDPARTLHAGAVELVLRMMRRFDEDHLLDRFRVGVRRWRDMVPETPAGPLRYEHLMPSFDPPPHWVIPPV